MLITLNENDICKILAEAFKDSDIISSPKFIVDVGVAEGKLVAIVAVEEAIPDSLQHVSDLLKPKAKATDSASTPVEPEADPEGPEEEDEETPEDGDTSEDDDDSKSSNAGQTKKRKRRTKAEIEADRLAEEQAQAAAEAVATEAVVTQEETAEEAEGDNPFADLTSEGKVSSVGFEEVAAESQLDDDTPPFNIDEGANVRAEAELLPEAKEAAVDDNDPFAAMGVSESDDELFAQPADAKVTQVTEVADGFVKPVEETDDPFASFN